MQRESLSDSPRRFIQQCRQYGLKVTPQRIAIYQALSDSREHPSADRIFQTVVQEFSNISFETVNRTLLKFAEIGILDVIESYSGARRFDPNLDHHHHIHCVRCGQIADFKDQQFDDLAIPKHIEQKNKVISKRVVINVICERCQTLKKEITHE